MQDLTLIQQISILALPLILAITVHEAAHGWMASRLGDQTARMLGRVTLNPIKHIDPIGTIAVPIGLYFLTGFIFGWAKPVPVNWRNLHNIRRDTALVALAGPLSNLLMAILWAIAIKIGLSIGDASPWVAKPLVYMGSMGILINAILLVLNLLPIPPLDGSRVVASLLPYNLQRYYYFLERWGMLILIGLMVSGLLGKLLFPMVGFVEGLTLTLVGLH